MNEFNLTQAVEEISIKNSLEAPLVTEVLSDTFKEALSEIMNVEEEDVRVESDGSGIFKISIVKEAVERVSNPNHEILLEEAKKIDEESSIGSEVAVPLEVSQINRQSMQLVNRMIGRAFLDIKKEVTFRDLKIKEDTLISGSVLRSHNRDFFVEIGQGIEARLPFFEQNTRDVYAIGAKMKFLLKEVSYDLKDRLNVTLSRADVNFVKRLFEISVPELSDGTVMIYNMVREAGKKVKMAVYATKAGVEPVGTCVGFSGVRIKEVLKELNGEKIDVVPYLEDARLFIERSLQPAKVKKIIIIDAEKKEAIGIIDDENYPLAVGKAGININLACQLTKWRINLKTISQIQKHPEILETFERVETLVRHSLEEDIAELSSLKEETLVKLMRSGITSISELYEKSKAELSLIEDMTEEEVQEIKKVIEETVEVVDEEMDLAAASEEMREFEDSIEGVETDERILEEVEQVEVLICPQCGFEFEYQEQTKCPSCGVEFEFQEE